MSDIVDRLNDSLSAGYSELRKEAAQEILQLRKERDALRAENVGSHPAPSVPEGWVNELLTIEHAMAMNNWNWNSDASDDLKLEAYTAVTRLLAAASEAKP